jgi:hypothetical protein
LSGNDYLETLNTLQFAAKCATIQNKVIINETPVAVSSGTLSKRPSAEHERARMVHFKKPRTSADGQIAKELTNEIPTKRPSSEHERPKPFPFKKPRISNDNDITKEPLLLRLEYILNFLKRKFKVLTTVSLIYTAQC